MTDSNPKLQDVSFVSEDVSAEKSKSHNQANRVSWYHEIEEEARAANISYAKQKSMERKGVPTVAGEDLKSLVNGVQSSKPSNNTDGMKQPHVMEEDIISLLKELFAAAPVPNLNRKEDAYVAGG